LGDAGNRDAELPLAGRCEGPVGKGDGPVDEVWPPANGVVCDTGVGRGEGTLGVNDGPGMNVKRKR
jgi:hypothetical protein